MPDDMYVYVCNRIVADRSAITSVPPIGDDDIFFREKTYTA